MAGNIHKMGSFGCSLKAEKPDDDPYDLRMYNLGVFSALEF